MQYGNSSISDGITMTRYCSRGCAEEILFSFGYINDSEGRLSIYRVSLYTLSKTLGYECLIDYSLHDCDEHSVD